MAVLSPNAIVDLVTPVENATQGRRSRMDTDRQLMRLEPYDINTDDTGLPAGSNYRSFTANEPMAFYRKVASVLADAKLLIQVPYGMAQEKERFRYDLAERFYYGVMAHANEMLRERIELEIQDQLSGIVPLRGWGWIVSLLTNRPDGTSVPMIQIWDARNTFWDVGSNGLEWLCYKSSRPARDIRREYPQARLDGKNDDDILDVYNFLDQTHNTVVTPAEVLKPSTEHGWYKVPGRGAPVGPMPRIWAENDVEKEDNDTETDYGESIFATNRKLFSTLNEVMSILLELASKQLYQTYVHKTDQEGSEMEESPNASDAVITIAREASLDPLNPVQSTRDLLVFLETVMGMIQRGALPHVSYGQLAINISGFAVTQLQKQFITVLGPLSKAIQSLIKDALMMITDQFISGRFNPLTVRGLGNNRDYMQITFYPEMLMNLPPPEIQLVAELPEDDVSRMAMAQQAKQGQILPDRYIWEKVLKLPDTSQIQRQMDDQMARIGSPQAMSYSLARSSFIEGNAELGNIYYRDMQIQRIMQELQLMQAMMTAQPMGGGQFLNRGQAPSALPPGFEPEVLPFIAQSRIPPQGLSNPGSNQLPGAPRPGARSAFDNTVPVVAAWSR